jgi:nucleoid DNA-binding protein
MKPTELAELIKQANPKLLGTIPEAKVAKIITATVREISKQIRTTDTGTVKIAGLGSFKMRQVEREKDGKMVSVKKIAFRTVKVKAKADDAG